jgi:hypothetical protein
MKCIRNVLTPVLCAAALVVLSCESLPFNYSESRAWRRGETVGTFRLVGVKVERSGSRDSIESELERLAPLVFGKRGYRITGEREKADYAVDIRANEREYSLDWRTKRSVSVEVRIWEDHETTPEAEEPFPDQRLPLAVGQVIFVGSGTLSSSAVINRILGRAVKKALGALDAEKGKQGQ